MFFVDDIVNQCASELAGIGDPDFGKIENIFIKQEDTSTKNYELVCGIIQAGDHKNVSKTDDVVILPVYDKNKQKKGYAAYQFNEILGLKPLEYWIKLDKFSGFGNPMFKVLVYKCMN